jgi:hypothetical protein
MRADWSKTHSEWLWAALGVSALTAIGLFFIPAFIIRPFTYQAPRALVLALTLRHRAPLGTLFAGLLCVALVLALWQVAKRWHKVVLSVVMVLVVFSTVMARLNYFEWMFHPVRNVQFELEDQTKLDAGEMIMAVRFGSDARAYPIREMAYHHMVNDTVGGTPIVVTY